MIIMHLLDDCAMGGVTTALKNFDDPRLTSFSASQTMEVNSRKAYAPKIQADVIIVHFTISWRKLAFLTSLRLRNSKAHIILIEHTYTEAFVKWNVPNKLRFQHMLKCGYALVDEVVAVSGAQADWLSAFVKFDIDAIPQSRPLSRFATVTPIDKVPGRPVIFGAIGRFHEQKGFDDLITAFRDPSLKGAHLILAGAGPQEDHLRELAGDATNIDFIGAVSDPMVFYSQADCVVIPSRWEAFGLVASEAMAAGRLVIASDVDGLTEQVRKRGVFVEPGNVMTLREAMRSVCALKRDHLSALGELGRVHAVSRYDRMIDAWKEKLVALNHSSRAARASSAADLSPMPTITSPGQYK